MTGISSFRMVMQTASWPPVTIFDIVPRGRVRTRCRLMMGVMDIFTPEKRSQVMSAIRGKDTTPELIVRRGLHAMGFRFSLHNARLPGKPDLFLKKYNAVVFVHGCFFHRHLCRIFRWPEQNAKFWREKLERNAERDREVRQLLTEKGIRWAVVWECRLKGMRNGRIEKTLLELARWLVSNEDSIEIGAIK
jgi:DNA mismatch endonuclease (patch repair protein)